jgi:hypothetical protein
MPENKSLQAQQVEVDTFAPVAAGFHIEDADPTDTDAIDWTTSEGHKHI